ncbi:uncharacterized protein FFB14_15148 [Fusarium fujikuroi]|nr:uncharacterized protein FFB14_15148 [Fusarium fujikuroi]
MATGPSAEREVLVEEEYVDVGVVREKAYDDDIPQPRGEYDNDASTSNKPPKETAKPANPEEELHTMEVDSSKAQKPPADEGKPPEVEEVCQGSVQEEQKATYVPFSSQHKLMILLQDALEGACFAYGQRRLPELLRRRSWNCAEAVALRTWMDEFILRRHTFDTTSLLFVPISLKEEILHLSFACTPASSPFTERGPVFLIPCRFF